MSLGLVMGLGWGRREMDTCCAPVVCGALVTCHRPHNAPWESGSVTPFTDDVEVQAGEVTCPGAGTAGQSDRRSV